MSLRGLSVYPAPVVLTTAAQPADVSAARDALLLALTAAKDSIEAGDIADLVPVLDAIAALPTTDVSAALATYGAATGANVADARDALAAAIADIPAPDLNAVLTAIAGIPTTDVATAVGGYITAARDVITAAITAVGGYITAARDIVTAAITTAQGVVTTAITAAQTAVNAHTDTAVFPLQTADDAATKYAALLAAMDAHVTTVIAATVPPGQLLLFSDITEIPAGYAQASGLGTLPPSLMSAVWSMPAPPETAPGVGNVFLLSCADGVHSMVLSGTVINSHTVLNEATGTWDARASSPVTFPAAPTTAAIVLPTVDGCIACGGTYTATDTIATSRYTSATNSWASAANLPAGGWSGGGGGVLADGRTVWVPASKRSGSTYAPNTDTWLLYTPGANTWAVVTAAASVPANYATHFAGNLAQLSLWGGRAWTPATGDKFCVMSQTTGLWYVIDATAHTIVETARQGPGIASNTSTGTPVWLVPSTDGVWLVGTSTVYMYHQATAAWTTTLPFMGMKFPATLTVSTYWTGRGHKMTNGLYYLGAGYNVLSAQALSIGSYVPGGAAYARKT